MHTTPHAKIASASTIPIPPSTPILSFSPIVLPSASRLLPLEVKITIPHIPNSSSPTTLPVLLLSHGHGPSNYLSSLEGYTPLASFYASHGFAVLQPTHLSSAFLALPSTKGNELKYLSRATDMTFLIDSLDQIESSVPFLKPANIVLSRSKIAIAGHSFGAWTASLLLGASNSDPREEINPFRAATAESRIKAGVLLAGPGAGGANLSELGRSILPFYDPSFEKMATPALVVYGDEDVSPHLTVRGADWHGDAYRLAPGPKGLVVLKGAKHGLGGVSGWDVAETQDESPERLAIVQRASWAYLWSRLHEGDMAWEEAVEALKGLEGVTVESKR